MTDEQERKQERKPDSELKNEKGQLPPEAPQARNISIEEVLSQYPIDRDKARDVLLVEISKNLGNIAVSLDHLVRLNMESLKESKVKKDEAV